MDRRAVPLALGLGGAALLLLVPLPSSWSGVWQSALFDLGHIPLFAALTLALRAAWGPGWARPVLAALALAGLAELLQGLGGRTGNLADFLLGALGVAVAVAGGRAWQARRHFLRLAGWLVVTAGLLAWPLSHYLPYALDAYEGAREAPTLADFRTARQLLRWRCGQATLTRVPDPGGGAWVGRAEFLPGASPYPEVVLWPIRRDWRGHRWLCCSFTVEGEEPLPLAISVRGGPVVEGGTCHFQQGGVYLPGPNRARLDLRVLAPRAEPRSFDLSDVRFIQFFLDRPARRRVVLLRRVWLEE